MSIRPVAPEHRLRICVVGDFDGPHTHGWVSYFVERGHDVHGIAYYGCARPPQGVQMHVLRPAEGGDILSQKDVRPRATARLGRRLPANAQRIINLLRYRRAGLADMVRHIAPDVLHAHYVVEHGLYATSANFHPYVVSAWGSDVLIDAAHSRVGRALAKFVVGRADQTTANNRHMAREMVLKLGIERAYVQHIVLGVSRQFLDDTATSVNLQAQDDGRLTILSTRSLDKPLYNIDTVVRAMAQVHQRVPAARLVIAGDGRLRGQFEQLARDEQLDDAVTFMGSLSESDLRIVMANAHAFVSVPSSDGTSVALLQAMALVASPSFLTYPASKSSFRMVNRDFVCGPETNLRCRRR